MASVRSCILKRQINEKKDGRFIIQIGGETSSEDEVDPPLDDIPLPGSGGKTSPKEEKKILESATDTTEGKSRPIKLIRKKLEELKQKQSKDEPQEEKKVSKEATKSQESTDNRRVVQQQKEQQAKVVDDMFKEFISKKMLEIEKDANAKITKEKDKDTSNKNDNDDKDSKSKKRKSDDGSKRHHKKHKREKQDRGSDKRDRKSEKERKSSESDGKNKQSNTFSTDELRSVTITKTSDSTSVVLKNEEKKEEKADIKEETILSEKSEKVSVSLKKDTIPEPLTLKSEIKKLVQSNSGEKLASTLASKIEKASSSDNASLESSITTTDTPKEGTDQKPKKLGLSLKISDSSVAFIASGEKYKDPAKQALLEEGEVSDSSSEDEDGEESDSDDEDEDEDEDDAGSIEDGEVGDKKSSKSKKKKKKKHKHKKKKKHKSKDKDGKKKSHKSRSKTPKKSRHSKSGSPDGFDRSAGVWRDRSRSPHRDDREYWRDGDRYRDRHRDYRDRDYRDGRDYRDERDYYERDRRRRSRSRERERERKKSEDLRLKIDKNKLREIAIANAYANAKAGSGPPINLRPDEIARLRAGGKSVDELTSFCKKISADGAHDGSSSSDDEDAVNKPHRSDEEADNPFIHHPFEVKKAAPIMLNIKNATPLPILTPSEKMAKSATLRLTFPVSSGSQHRNKETEWVPVEKKTVDPKTGKETTTLAMAKQSDKVFEEIPPDAPPVNIGDIVSERLKAVRKLADNPNDVQAMGEVYKINQKMTQWAQSKNLPGQFTGSTGAQVLSQQELVGDPKHQAWLKKDQLSKAAPLSGGIGMMLLQRMGWKHGEGLGKNNEGPTTPLQLDFKIDRKGLTSQGENVRRVPVAPIQRDLSGKHPVSALVELCNKRRWGSPDFQLVHESGPSHKKHFLYKVVCNGIEYQPSVASNNKKAAKAMAATAALQTMGLVPKT